MADAVYEWYSREDVQKALLEVAKDREIVSVFKDGRFGRRPEILQYPSDILHAVKEGAVSFHGSVERWHQPMKLDTGMTKIQLDELRRGWDVLIDMDLSDFEIAKATVKEVIKALKDHGVNSYGLKFTGGKSFHIIVPFESMPSKIDMKPTEKLYPDAMKKIIEYIKWYIKEPLREEMSRIGSPSELAERCGKKTEEIMDNEYIDPFKIVDMDIFGSRHMFRLPYSLHEKSGLVSMPINVENIDGFKKEDARPEVVKTMNKFLIKEGMKDGSALVVEAFDWAAKYMKEKELPQLKEKKKRKVTKIAEENFPPCIKSILNGIADGRKRSVFVLINFLRNVGWEQEDMIKRLSEWNEKNYPPLRTNYIRSQIRWHLNQDRNLLPPNCNNENFYCRFNACKPDGICAFGSKNEVEPCSPEITIKNPVNYAFKKIGAKKKFGKKKRKYYKKSTKPRKAF